MSDDLQIDDEPDAGWEEECDPWNPPDAEPEHRFFDADDGMKLHYVEWPGPAGSPAVLMLHGRRAHARWFDPVAPALAARYRCAALDLRGHGESGRGGEADFHRYAADIAQFAARFEGAPRILLAHSMSGRPAIYACSEFGLKPDLLVMADTPLSRRPHHFKPEPPIKSRKFPDRESAIRRFRLMPGGTSANPDLLRHIAEHAIRQEEDGAWSWKFDEEGTTRPVGFRMPDFGELPLEAIECPTLIIHGEHSVLMDAEDAQAVAARFRRGAWKTIPGAHHHLMLDRPAAFNAALLEFIARQGY